MNSDPRGRDILLAGLPRSGTTMTCHLLNAVPNSVALHEPLRPGEMAGLPPRAIDERIAAFFTAQREQILRSRTATSKSYRRGVPTNPVGDRMEDGSRRRIIDGKEIDVGNVDRRDFTLLIKHPSFFTAALPDLAGSFECYAIVRNPLAVLLSWRNTEMAVSRGRVPAAEAFDAALAANLDAREEALDRQLLLLDYFFDRFATFLPDRTIRYEDIVASRGSELSRIVPAAASLRSDLESRNLLAFSTDGRAFELGAALAGRDGPHRRFYPPEDILDLLGSARARMEGA